MDPPGQTDFENGKNSANNFLKHGPWNYYAWLPDWLVYHELTDSFPVPIGKQSNWLADLANIDHQTAFLTDIANMDRQISFLTDSANMEHQMAFMTDLALMHHQTALWPT